MVSQKPNQPLSEATWIVFQTAGFSTEEEARRFGEQLRKIAEFAGLCPRLGIDVGKDEPTGWVSEEFVRFRGLIQPHERILPNIHGLAIFPDDGNTRFPLVEVDAIVRAVPEQLLNTMTEVAIGFPANFSTAENGVRILNLALINPQPLARIAHSLSATESLGQDETWTQRQTVLISELAMQVESSSNSDAEYKEVTEAKRPVPRHAGDDRGRHCAISY